MWILAESAVPDLPTWADALGAVSALALILVLWLRGVLVRGADHEKLVAAAVDRAERAEIEVEAWKEAYHEQVEARRAAELAASTAAGSSEITLRLLGAFESVVTRHQGREGG